MLQVRCGHDFIIEVVSMMVILRRLLLLLMHEDVVVMMICVFRGAVSVVVVGCMMRQRCVGKRRGRPRDVQALVVVLVRDMGPVRVADG